jgi:hypothetical protein
VSENVNPRLVSIVFSLENRTQVLVLLWAVWPGGALSLVNAIAGSGMCHSSLEDTDAFV